MAGAVDILLRILGDSRDAVRSVDEVGNAADRSTTRVGRLSQSLAGVAARAGAIGTAALGIVEGYERAAQMLDDILNREPQQDVSGATSAADTARRLTSAGGTRFRDVFSLRSVTGSGWGWFGLAGGGENMNARRRVEAEIDALAASNPAQLQASLPFLPPDRAEYARRALANQASARAFQASLSAPSAGGAAPGGSTVVVNTGVGDRNQIGREVRSVLDARDRNNGRYVTTYTRR